MPEAIPLSRALSSAAYLLYRLQSLAIGTLTGQAARLSVVEGEALMALLAAPRAATEEEWQAFLHHAGHFTDHRTGGPTAEAVLTVLALGDDPRDARGLLRPFALWSLATALLAGSRTQDVVALKFHAWVKTVALLDGQDRPGPVRSPWAIWTLVLLARDSGVFSDAATRSGMTGLADQLAGSKIYVPDFAEAFACCEIARVIGKQAGADTMGRLSQTGLAGLPRYGFTRGAAACPTIPRHLDTFLSRNLGNVA